MNHLVAALFTDSKSAGEAVADLKQKGYTKDISLIAKDVNAYGSNTHQIKQDTTDGAVAGATTGGILGALVGAAMTVSVAATGVGALLIAGPLAALLGATGGALTGGLLGALVDLGIPDQKAKMFEDAIRSGETLVTVSVDETKIQEVYKILESYGAHESGDIKLPGTM